METDNLLLSDKLNAAKIVFLLPIFIQKFRRGKISKNGSGSNETNVKLIKIPTTKKLPGSTFRKRRQTPEKIAICLWRRWNINLQRQKLKCLPFTASEKTNTNLNTEAEESNAN